MTSESEEILLKSLSKYLNKSQHELINNLDIKVVNKLPKNIRNIVLNRIINKYEVISGEKVNLIIKTIRVNSKLSPIESMSFAQIKYNEIINESWENSYLFNLLNKTFLFVVFLADSPNKKNPILLKFIIWKMNPEDLDLANKFWELTKQNIKIGDYDNFISIKNNFLLHVRSKGINSKDLMLTPQGTLVAKKGFWLNSKYLKSIIT